MDNHIKFTIESVKPKIKNQKRAGTALPGGSKPRTQTGSGFHFALWRRPGHTGTRPLRIKSCAKWQELENFVEDRRYVVCLNEEQARKDARDRKVIVASLREQLKRGDKSLVGNRGFRKYLKQAKPKFEIDEKKIKQETRYDGKWVLRTNTDLSAAEVALKFNQLWMVEHVFRSAKSLLETRPIRHKRDELASRHRQPCNKSRLHNHANPPCPQRPRLVSRPNRVCVTRSITTGWGFEVSKIRIA